MCSRLAEDIFWAPAPFLEAHTTNPMKLSPGAPFRAVAVTALIFACALPALASLGGDVSSVEADRIHMKALTRMTQTNGYDLHQIQSPAGTLVSEYVSPSSGKVFAVTWQGPFPPDMQQLLGSYFQQYTQALQSQERHFGHRPLNIRLPGMVVQTGGHMRAYYGRIYIPEMLPQGTRAEDLR